MIDSAGALISGPLTYEHLERNAPWFHSYGLNQVFQRSLVEFFDVWDQSVDHFHANERMAHDQFVFFLSSLLGRTVTIKNVLLHYRQHGNNAVGFIADADHGGFARAFLRTFDHLRDRDRGARKRKYVLGTLRGRISAAIARQAMTEQVMSRLPENRAQELLPKLRYYENHVRYLSARLAAYERPSRAQRAGAMLSALGKGFYKDAGRTGARDVGADLLYGVLGSQSPNLRDP